MKRYPKENNPIRDSIFQIKSELKHLTFDIRNNKKILDQNFPDGLYEEETKNKYSVVHKNLNQLRKEYRYLHIIYGLVRHKPFIKMEAKTSKKVDWNILQSYAQRYGLNNHIDFETSKKQYHEVFVY